MNRPQTLTHEFVEFVPRELKDGVLYVSMPYATVIHKCCCGCGEQVVTPLAPAQWTLTFDGQSISLHPSVGNWNFACKSHYWIKQNKVLWAREWSKAQIAAGQQRDARAVRDGFTATSPSMKEPSDNIESTARKPRPSLLAKVKRFFGK